MAIAWSDVENFESGASAIDADAQTDILAHVNAYFKPAVFGGEGAAKLKLARIYLAAHLASLILRGPDAVGPLTMEREGGLSVQYSTLSGDAALSATNYGEQLKALIRSTYARVPVVV